MKLIGIDDPDLTHAGREVFTSFSKIPEDLADFAARLDLDYDGSNEEVEIDPYESRKINMATQDNTQVATELGHQHPDHHPIPATLQRSTQFWHEQ